MLRSIGTVSGQYVMIGFLLGIVGCSGTRKDHNPDDRVTSQSPDHSPDIDRPDLSLAEEEYLRAGVPALDEPWRADEMTAAYEAINALLREKPNALPRKGSKQSGKVFTRLSSDRDLAQFQEGTQPIAKRLEGFTGYLNASNAVFKLYVVRTERGEGLDREAVELARKNFRVFTVAVAVVNEFLPTLDKKDPTYSVRLEGVAQLHHSIADMMQGALTMLTEKNRYRLSERTRLLEYLSELFPPLWPPLTAADRSKVLRQLDELLSSPAMNELRTGLQALRDRLSSVPLR